MKEIILEDTSILYVPEINEAISLLEKSSFSDGELFVYDKYWDIIRTEKTLFEGKFREGFEEGFKEAIELARQKGIELGRQKGIELGKLQAKRASVPKLKKLGVSTNVIMQATGLSENEINDL